VRRRADPTAGDPVTGRAPATSEPLDGDLRVEAAGWGTDFSKHTVPLSEIESGGPGKDGTPAIDVPAFVPVEEAGGWLEPREPVIELELGGKARAYPLQILIWHEIVNDTVAGTPVAVTFCPPLQYRGRLRPAPRRPGARFRHDREPPQLGPRHVRPPDRELVAAVRRRGDRRRARWEEARADPGPHRRLGGLRGSPPGRLGALERNRPQPPLWAEPVRRVRQRRHPPIFPAANLDDRRLPPKERVAYVERGGEAVAVPFSALERKRTIAAAVGGERLEFVWVPGVRSSLDEASIPAGREVGSALVRSVGTGELVPFDQPFWFAVAAFRPDVRIVKG